MYSLLHFLPPDEYRRFQFLFIFKNKALQQILNPLKKHKVYPNIDFLQSRRKPLVAVKFTREHSSTPHKMTLPFQSFTWVYPAFKCFCHNHPLPLLLHHLCQTSRQCSGEKSTPCRVFSSFQFYRDLGNAHHHYVQEHNLEHSTPGWCEPGEFCSHFSLWGVNHHGRRGAHIVF